QHELTLKWKRDAEAQDEYRQSLDRANQRPRRDDRRLLPQSVRGTPGVAGREEQRRGPRPLAGGPPRTRRGPREDQAEPRQHQERPAQAGTQEARKKEEGRTPGRGNCRFHGHSPSQELEGVGSFGAGDRRLPDDRKEDGQGGAGRRHRLAPAGPQRGGVEDGRVGCDGLRFWSRSVSSVLSPSRTPPLLG